MQTLSPRFKAEAALRNTVAIAYYAQNTSAKNTRRKRGAHRDEGQTQTLSHWLSLPAHTSWQNHTQSAHAYKCTYPVSHLDIQLISGPHFNEIFLVLFLFCLVSPPARVTAGSDSNLHMTWCFTSEELLWMACFPLTFHWGTEAPCGVESKRGKSASVIPL